MSDNTVTQGRRDERGRLLPGFANINPSGRPRNPEDTPKFSRSALQKVCVEEDYEPIRALIALSRSKGASPYLQFAVHKEIAEYLYPKLRSVVIGDADTDGGNTIRIAWDNAPTDPPKPDRDKQRDKFVNAMDDAHTRIIDAVMSDDESEP